MTLERHRDVKYKSRIDNGTEISFPSEIILERIRICIFFFFSLFRSDAREGMNSFSHKFQRTGLRT